MSIFRRLSILLLLLGMSNHLMAQFKLPEFDLSIGFGISNPVAEFAGDDFQASLVASELFPGFAEGVTKRDNGFAKTGFQYHARLGFQVLGAKLSVQGEKAQHGLRSDELGESLSSRYNFAYTYVQEDYERTALLFGISKGIRLFKIDLDATFLAGSSTLQFPQFAYVSPNSDWRIDRFQSDTSDLSAFTYGFEARAQYPIGKLLSVGGFLNYQRADYDYFYDLIGRPGGSSLLEFNDTVSYRKIDLGVFISVGF